MAHHISALIAKAPVDEDAARALDLPVIVQNGYAIVPLYHRHCDVWAGKLGVTPVDGERMIILDRPVTHEFARRLGLRRYALIETEYFGGHGTQFAALYGGDRLELEPTEGSINLALKLLGVERQPGLDEFDTIGLGNHRSFEDLFEKYWN